MITIYEDCGILVSLITILIDVVFVDECKRQWYE